jgi:hypothetical protein
MAVLETRGGPDIRSSLIDLRFNDEHKVLSAIDCPDSL